MGGEEAERGHAKLWWRLSETTLDHGDRAHGAVLAAASAIQRKGRNSWLREEHPRASSAPERKRKSPSLASPR